MGTLRRTVYKSLNAAIGPFGLELIPIGKPAYLRSFLPLKRTLRNAKEAGLSLCDYIDAKHQVPGATEATINQLKGLDVLSSRTRNVCEIGPGSGRYLEKVLASCAPAKYDIYETAREWSDWLARTYSVRACEADGQSLRQTEDASMDLVHAHKVFVYIPSVVTFRYLNEMIRVSQTGGYIVFDIVSQSCMDDLTITKWNAGQSNYITMMPKEVVIGFFAKRHCSLLSCFHAPLVPGSSEYLVFCKNRLS